MFLMVKPENLTVLALAERTPGSTGLRTLTRPFFIFILYRSATTDLPSG